MRALSSTVAALVLFAGCASTADNGTGNDDPSSNPKPPSTSTVPHGQSTTPTPTTGAVAPRPDRSPRGNVTRGLGEYARLCLDRDCNEVAAAFTVTSVDKDIRCTAKYGEQPPKNGHLLAVHLSVWTTGKFTREQALMLMLPAHAFTIVGPDGVTESDVAGGFGCLPDSELMPSSLMSPNSQYGGKVVLDARNTTGTLVIRLSGELSGWEWPF